MGQWGHKHWIKGALFCPFIDTKLWRQAEPQDLIISIALIDVGSDLVAAKNTLSELKERYLNKPCVKWWRLFSI